MRARLFKLASLPQVLENLTAEEVVSGFGLGQNAPHVKYEKWPMVWRAMVSLVSARGATRMSEAAKLGLDEAADFWMRHTGACIQMGMIVGVLLGQMSAQVDAGIVEEVEVPEGGSGVPNIELN
jgi:hypothetical protein